MQDPAAVPLTKDPIRIALFKPSLISAPGPNGIPYSLWKMVNVINPTIIMALRSPLVAFCYHPPSLKTAKEVVLDKPTKASYDSPHSFRIIVVSTMISKILEWVTTFRLSAIAWSKGLLDPIQCGSLPGLHSSDACLPLMHVARTLQRLRLKVSPLFVDINAGFDTANASTLRAKLLPTQTPSYMVDWVSSFLSEWFCTLVFPAPPTSPPGPLWPPPKDH